MAQDYTEYLAINVLNEQQIVRSVKTLLEDTNSYQPGQLQTAQQSIESACQLREAVGTLTIFSYVPYMLKQP